MVKNVEQYFPKPKMTSLFSANPQILSPKSKETKEITFEKLESENFDFFAWKNTHTG